MGPKPTELIEAMSSRVSSVTGGRTTRRLIHTLLAFGVVRRIGDNGAASPRGPAHGPVRVVGFRHRRLRHCATRRITPERAWHGHLQFPTRPARRTAR